MKPAKPIRVFDAELSRDIGSYEKGTRGVFEEYEGGPHAFFPFLSNGMLGYVGYTVTQRDVILFQEVEK
jgi:hypothetical protein